MTPSLHKIEGDELVLKLNKYCKPKTIFEVVNDRVDSSFVRDCQLFESCSIPCSHVICAMKNNNVDYITKSLIYNRWVKCAKRDLILSTRSKELDLDVMKVALFGAVVAACNNYAILLPKSKYFKDIMDEIFKLTNKYKNKSDLRGTHVTWKRY
ncbi:hypothetical protein L6164_033371 [Bauhinia variegata]|uniref:Uncharacterized protein n=1 Tax=Bauhinia variegata TaxID=167791 RepID=A0ACB9KRL7_BAUVA|nr:hypothetical protein L6164_033371 [Bauhinia variegata]